MSGENQIIPLKDIQNRIFTIRGVQVIIDRELAEMYGVETRRLINEQVKNENQHLPLP